jgi:hypothetical protein
MRLAFAVTVATDPDILFIDEILAVGDFRFRQKCLARVRKMRERSAFVLVTHSMADVRMFCDRAMVLSKGSIAFMGAPARAIETYEALKEGDHPASHLETLLGPQFENTELIEGVESFWSDGEGRAIETTPFGNAVHMTIRFTSRIALRRLIVGVPLYDTSGQLVTGLSTQVTSDVFDVGQGETVTLRLTVPRPALNPGVHKAMLTILEGAEYLYRRPCPDLRIGPAPHPTWGAVTVPHVWRRV